MKQRKLAPILALTMSLEMMLSPVAFAQKKKEVGVNDVFNTVLGVASNIYEQIRSTNQPMSPQTAQDMAGLSNQQKPMSDKYFSGQKLSQIPGLGQYLAMNGINPNSLNCVTLPTNLYEAHNEICRVGVTGDKGNPMAQIAEAQAYAQQYSAIDKMYRNFTSESNVGGELFGVGCMKNAMQVLNGFFKYRMDELDKLVTNIEALQANFKENSRADLDAIEESTAVLNGGGSELANKVKSRRPDLFDYGKRFDNPACKSMFGKEDFNKLGKGGLNAVNQKLQDTVNEKVGEMGFSGDSYSKSHNDILADINNLADKVGKQAELGADSMSKNPVGFLKDIPGLVSSPNGLNKAIGGDFFVDMTSKFSENNTKLDASKAEIEAEIGQGAATQLAGQTQNDGSFEAEVSKLEIGIKNNCLKGQAQVDEVLGRMYDPSASGFANKNASNYMRDKLKQIMDDDSTSFEKKMSELKSLEGQQGARYYVKMENSYEVQEVGSDGKIAKRVVEASTARTPSVYFTDVIKSCDAQFKVNSKNGKMSPAQAIQKLRQLKQDYKTQAKANAKAMKDEIKKKLISCDSPAKANNTVPGSCSPQSFDTSKPGFCANGAFSCSKSMQTCSKQAEKFVTDIKTERAARVNNYKNMVEKNKKDIIKIFDSALSRYMKDGELLRGTFGAGFSSPSGIQRDVPEGQRHLGLFKEATSGSPDGALLLEDPEKFTAMFKANISLLKKSVQDQQDQILGGSVGSNSGLLAKHIEDTKAKYTKVAAEAGKFSKECQGAHDKYVAEMEGARKQQSAEMAKKQSELGEKQKEFCRKYSMAMTNPGPACSGNLDSLFSTVGGLGGNGAEAANEMERVCAGAQHSTGGGGDSIKQAQKICKELGFEKPKEKEDPALESKKAAKKTAERKLADAKLTVQKAEAKVMAAKAKVPKVDADITTAESELASAKIALLDLEQAVVDATRAIEDYKPASAAEVAKGSAPKKPEPPAPADAKAKEEADKKAAAQEEKAEMKAKCDELYRCSQRKYSYSEDSSKKPVSDTECIASEIEAVAEIVVESNGGKITADEELMPAFCNAGNGSMGPPKNFFESMSQGMQKGLAGGGAMGQ